MYHCRAESQAGIITQRLRERLGLVSGDVACARVGDDVAQAREPLGAVTPGWSVFPEWSPRTQGHRECVLAFSSRYAAAC